MSNINIHIEDGTVTGIREFTSRIGYGADFFVEAKGDKCTVYFQVTVYDDTARSYRSYIHEGDHVIVTGDLKDKVYKKSDGSEGHSLIIERPINLRKIVRGTSGMQVPQNNTEDEDDFLDLIFGEDEAATVSAVTASENGDNLTRNEIISAEENADTARQEPQAETAKAESKVESVLEIPQKRPSTYADPSGRTQYPLATPKDEEDLPF